MVDVHYRNITAPDDAADIICAAARLGAQYDNDPPDAPRYPVTLGFWETRKELRPVKKRDGSVVDEWKPVKPAQYVHAVRTMEFFHYEESEEGNAFLQGLDRCPRDSKDWSRHGPPAVRAVRIDRITDLTVHRKSRYLLQNQYFIVKAREFAEEQGLSKVLKLTDDALWEVIKRAHSRQDAEVRALRYATR